MGISNFNPRSPHGERHDSGALGVAGVIISIHAPRTGSDRKWCTTLLWGWSFQSTLPARGATRTACKHFRYVGNFNPRSPHGERLPAVLRPQYSHAISIHAPRTGSDVCGVFYLFVAHAIFQSTLPARGATFVTSDNSPFAIISIHAPRTGSDVFW